MPPCCGRSPASARAGSRRRRAASIASRRAGRCSSWPCCWCWSSIVWKRWRHLFAFLGSVVVLRLIGLALHAAHRRPRPYDVTTIGTWNGYSSPSATAAIVSIAVVGVIYMVVVPGRPRSIAKIAGAVLIALVAGARLYLAVDHPFDVIAGVALGITVPLLAFRYLAPSEVVSVSYDGGKKAHLDITGRRGDALRRAVEDQLGAVVTEVRPVGLAGSGGSTPLRLRLAGDPETFVFGKLYALNHVRSDRWYKLGRFVLYGGLEDEAPFPTVRRLVEYEDYALRLMRDAGIATAAPLGIVELTPEREYMLVTEFMDGAEEIGDADIDDQIIDEGLALVRRLWDAGLAHRDIKPANLLVVDGHLVMIDVAFAQVRPSPWRQAVDLANMMLVLAVRTDARSRLRPSADVLQPGRDRRGVRRSTRRRQPVAAAIGAQARRARSGRRVPTARPCPGSDLTAALGTTPRRAGRCDRGLRRDRRHQRGVDGRSRRAPDDRHPDVRHEQHHDPHGAGSPERRTPSRASMRFLPDGPSAASPSGPPTRSSGSTPIATAPTPCRSGSAQPIVARANATTRSTAPPLAGNRSSHPSGVRRTTDPHVRVRYSVHHPRVRSRHRRGHDGPPRQRPRAPTSHRPRRRSPPPLRTRALRGRVVRMHR